MSVTIKQSDVSNNVRMGVLCYCYSFCGQLSPDWSPLSLQLPHSGSISTPAASGWRDACSRLVWELQPALSTLPSTPHPLWGLGRLTLSGFLGLGGGCGANRWVVLTVFYVPLAGARHPCFTRGERRVSPVLPPVIRLYKHLTLLTINLLFRQFQHAQHSTLTHNWEPFSKTVLPRSVFI